MSSTKQQHLDQVAHLAGRMVEIVAQQPTHRVALEALISAYASVAMCHPCCAQYAAQAARRMADLIETHAAPQDAANLH